MNSAQNFTLLFLIQKVEIFALKDVFMLLLIGGMIACYQIMYDIKIYLDGSFRIRDKSNEVIRHLFSSNQFQIVHIISPACFNTFQWCRMIPIFTKTLKIMKVEEELNL